MMTYQRYVPACADADNALAINAAIADLATNCGGGEVLLDAAVYPIATSIARKSNITIKGAFRGAWLFDLAPTKGTVLKWTGPNGGAMLADMPASDEDQFTGGGVCDLAIDGAGTAALGIYAASTSSAAYRRLHICNVTGSALYFGESKTTKLPVSYCIRDQVEDVTISVTGQGNGIVINVACFFNLQSCFVTHLNGSAFAILSGDDNTFTQCAAARADGGTGMAVYLHGTNDGSNHGAVGNTFYGFKSNAPIRAVGGAYASRGNMFLPMTAVDGASTIYQDKDATLTVLCSDGETIFNGFARGFPPLQNA